MTRPRLGEHAPALARRLLADRPALLALDFDGTLTEVVDDPRAPRLTPERRAVLTRVAAVPGLRVVVVSGRALSDVRERVGVEGFTVVGNHGFEMDGWAAPGVAEARPLLQEFLRWLESDPAGLPTIEIEDKGATATVHLRGERTQAARQRLLDVLGRRLAGRAAAAAALRLHPGKNSVEVRPALEWDKARAVLALLGRWRIPPGRAFYAGDDVTDECVFEALREGITVRVGEGETAAAFVASGPDEVYDFLERIDGP